MKKYNLSEIMTNAWTLYRTSQKWVSPLSFSDCLRRAWSKAKEVIKEAAEAAKTGLRRMHYSEYKRDYSDCQTVEGSYDKRTKTIEVMTRKFKTARAAFAGRVHGLCPRCHTYCYGDCCAR